MSWDAFQREALAELGLSAWVPRAPGSETPPPDPRVAALLARAAGMTPQALSEAGMQLPGYERLRDPAVKRALWPLLRGARRRP